VQGLDWLSVRRRVGDDPWLGAAGTAGFGLLDLEGRGVFAALDTRTNKVVWRKQWPTRNTRGSGGALTTAGGLVFRGTDDGAFEAYHASGGERLWQFQTGAVPARIASPASYEVDGEQYIAFPSGGVIWAFKLGGRLPELPRPPASAAPEVGGRVQDTNQIETASLIGGAVLTGGRRYAMDEHSFSPLRARVSVGTPVTWVNNGRLSHTIVAQDGSWSVGRLSPSHEGSVSFTTPGTFLYICKDHPWAIGQLIVVEAPPATPRPVDATAGRSPAADASTGDSEGLYTDAQAERGETAYNQRCSTCHTADLNAGGVVPPLAGDAFIRPWRGRALVDLFERIRITMPPESPGGLSRDVYLDILAYLLQSNGLRAGRQELNDSLLSRSLPR
jgi:plastocyanin